MIRAPLKQIRTVAYAWRLEHRRQEAIIRLVGLPDQVILTASRQIGRIRFIIAIQGRQII